MSRRHFTHGVLLYIRNTVAVNWVVQFYHTDQPCVAVRLDLLLIIIIMFFAGRSRSSSVFSGGSPLKCEYGIPFIVSYRVICFITRSDNVKPGTYLL